MELEQWRPVVGFEGLYEISSFGRIKSLKCNRIKFLSVAKGLNRYCNVTLMKEKKKYTVFIHRALGIAFLPRIEGKDTIDHIDRNPSNNHISNLRWADSTEQNINKEHYSNTNEKNISQNINSGNFHLVIRRYKTTLVNAAFSTLEEAIAARDEFLSSLEMS
jgi:hypothetical protein